MTAGGKSFFDQFLDDYFLESEEHLTSARNALLAIEAAGPNKPVEANVLDGLLRDFHSLKGLSAMVGLEDATQLAHHIEDYLRELNRPNKTISQEGIERVMAGITAIEQVIEAKRKSLTPPDTSMVLLHLDAAADELRGGGATPPPEPETAGSMWRVVFRSSAEMAAKGLTVGSVREQLRKIGEVMHATPQVLTDGNIAFEFVLAASAPESALAGLQSQGIEYSRIADSMLKLPTKEPTAESPQASSTPSNVIRVEMSRLDDLMRLVGELVISRFRLNELLRESAGSNGWSALQEINLGMERQLRDLRESVMRIRMVPIGQVFERMRFVARGLERELNKRVEVQIVGQDTEIDKLIVERMVDPLLHLVRNAVSHGLESPEERAAVGKPPTGVIRLSAMTAGDTVIVEVEDDGRGLDWDGIASRARTLGWIGENEELQPKRLLDIISTPGFTTREQADLASGRGVGMAAVQKTVDELGGSVSVDTKPGEGTRFTIRLPLTLLIADALMVTVNQQRFAVPQTAVREVLAVESSSLRSFENNEVIPFRGGVLPVLRLSRLFGLPQREQKRMHLLVIEHSGSPAGIAVDRITGQREIVVRTITDPFVRVPGVVGATELGDGQPVLILDPYSLIRTARNLNAAEAS
jgi:two-component system chemotaxis sensor kinase CheA